VLQKPIAYGGDDGAAFEENLRKVMPAWMAFDIRLMAERFSTDGMVPEDGMCSIRRSRWGRPLRSYRDFATDVAPDEVRS
jgi:hypothetical protein